MATRQDETLRPQFNTLFNLGATRERTDGQLLERFATERSELAELAFAALVERHGAMVMRVCRTQLASPQDAQDAFQATFLILVKKARSLWVQDSLGPWLHKVALRTASCARADAARRRRREQNAGAIAALSRGQEKGLDVEFGQRLHEEIDRLPDRYRIPIVLCDLEGHTCEEAARQMGRPVGTIKSWRSRGREQLRLRLIRGGLVPSSFLTATLAADAARGTAPKPGAATVRAAARIRDDRTTPGEVSASVWMLVKGVMTTMLLSKLRTAAVLVGALPLFAAGVGTVARGIADDRKSSLDEPPKRASRRPEIRSTPPMPKETRDEAWNLTLNDAVRIGLEHSETMRVRQGTKGGGANDGYEIIPRSTDQDRNRLKSETMAHVRSIEQQYWSLAQHHAQLWASEKAVELAEEVKKYAESELKAGTGTVADVAEATQRLEQFRLDLLTKSTDIDVTERGLRNILGLPAIDRRRIVPISKFRDEKVSPDWDASLATMLEKQPDIAGQRAIVKKAEEQLGAADPAKPNNSTASRPEKQATHESSNSQAESRSAQYRLMKQKDYLQQIIFQTTNSLSRFLREIDANYQQLQTAARLRSASQNRLEALHAFYQDGRITIDRYLDAISQYASAVAQEAMYKSSYNVSLAALEEAKGTLLEHRHITIVEGSSESAPSSEKRDKAARPAAHESLFLRPDAPTAPQSPTQDVASPAEAEHPKADTTGKGFSFEMTIPIGPKPVTIRGSFSVAPAPANDSSEVP